MTAIVQHAFENNILVCPVKDTYSLRGRIDWPQVKIKVRMLVSETDRPTYTIEFLKSIFTKYWNPNNERLTDKSTEKLRDVLKTENVKQMLGM